MRDAQANSKAHILVQRVEQGVGELADFDERLHVALTQAQHHPAEHQVQRRQHRVEVLDKCRQQHVDGGQVACEVLAKQGRPADSQR